MVKRILSYLLPIKIYQKNLQLVKILKLPGIMDNWF